MQVNKETKAGFEQNILQSLSKRPASYNFNGEIKQYPPKVDTKQIKAKYTNRTTIQKVDTVDMPINSSYLPEYNHFDGERENELEYLRNNQENNETDSDYDINK